MSQPLTEQAVQQEELPRTNTVLGLAVDIKKSGPSEWTISGPNAASVKSQMAMHGIVGRPFTADSFTVDLGALQTAIGKKAHTSIATNVLMQLADTTGPKLG